jgi:hypothetical protein
MSPQQPLQLEGASLEELLDQVRREHGPQAQIVKAEKLRRGGVGGFFAKESYVIEVSVDPTATPAAAAAPAAGPRSVLDLVDQRNAEEHGSSSGLSTQTDAFSTMLARLQREAMEPEDDFVMVRPKVVPSQATVPAPRQAPESVVPPAVRRVEDLYTADLDDESAADEEPVALAVVPEPEVEVEVLPAPTPTRRRGDSKARTAKRPARAGKTVAVPTPRDLTVGLPARLVAADGSLDAGSLMQWQRALPTPPQPSVEAGEVIALVGPVEETYATATRLAADLGIDPGETTVVSRTATLPGTTALTDPAAVAKSRRAWARRDTASIVVIDAPMTARRGAAWRDEVLDEVGATFTYGVLPATTKPEDLGSWAERLGGVDALALYDVTETTQPATALQSGIPIALLDGSTATPAAWAGLLLDRMVAA